MVVLAVMVAVYWRMWQLVLGVLVPGTHSTLHMFRIATLSLLSICAVVRFCRPSYDAAGAELDTRHSRTHTPANLLRSHATHTPVVMTSRAAAVNMSSRLLQVLNLVYASRKMDFGTEYRSAGHSTRHRGMQTLALRSAASGWCRCQESRTALPRRHAAAPCRPRPAR